MIQHFDTMTKFLRQPRGEWGGKDSFVYGIFAGNIFKVGTSNSPRMRIPEAIRGNAFGNRKVDAIYIVGPVAAREHVRSTHPLEYAIQAALIPFQVKDQYSRSRRRDFFRLPQSVRTEVEEWFLSECAAWRLDYIINLADQQEALA